MYFQEYPFIETIYKQLPCTIIKTGIEMMGLAGSQNNKSLQINTGKCRIFVVLHWKVQ